MGLSCGGGDGNCGWRYCRRARNKVGEGDFDFDFLAAPVPKLYFARAYNTGNENLLSSGV